MSYSGGLSDKDNHSLTGVVKPIPPKGMSLLRCTFMPMLKVSVFKKSIAIPSSWPQQAGVVLLLFFYLAAFVHSPVGVPHLHHEEDLHHGDSCEKDACHIAVFHPGGEGHCDHKFHFTQTNEDCDLCHIVLPRQVVSKVTLFAECKIEFSPYSHHGNFEIVAAPRLLHADRGPPVLI